MKRFNNLHDRVIMMMLLFFVLAGLGMVLGLCTAYEQ